MEVEREEVPAEEQHGGAGGGCASIPPDSAASPVEMERCQPVRVRGNWAREARSQPFSLGFFSRGKRRSFFPAAIHFFFVLFFSSLFDQLALKKSLFDQQTFTSS